MEGRGMTSLRGSENRLWPFNEAPGNGNAITEVKSGLNDNNSLRAGSVHTGFSLITDGIGVGYQHKNTQADMPLQGGSDGAMWNCMRPAEDIDNVNHTVFHSAEGGGAAGTRILLTLDDLNFPVGGFRNFLSDSGNAGFVASNAHAFIFNEILPVCFVWGWDDSAMIYRVVVKMKDQDQNDIIDFSETDSTNTTNVTEGGITFGSNEGLSAFYANEYFEHGTVFATFPSIADMQDTADGALLQAHADLGFMGDGTGSRGSILVGGSVNKGEVRGRR